MPTSASAAFLTARQAAEQLGVCERTVRRWIATGQLAAVKQGRIFRIALGDLEPLHRRLQEEEEPLFANEPPATFIPPPTAFDQPLAADEAAELADLVRELQDQIVRQSEVAAIYQAQATFLADELRRTQARLGSRRRGRPPGSDDGRRFEPGGSDPPPPVQATLAILVVIVLSLLLIYGLDLMDLPLP